jgi:hypothetical protein
MQVTGRRGELLAAGRPAALLGAWTLTRPEGGATYQLNVHIAKVQDEYLLENARTFTVRLPAGNKIWQWRNALCVTDGQDATLTMEGRTECLETDL